MIADTAISAGDLPGLPLTGERTVPGIPEENYWFRRHEVAYEYLARYCAEAVVLEAGCGAGYGAAVLARVARRVVALDYDALTTVHVMRRYPGLAVVRGNLAALPAATSTVDVVANLQVIEHLWDQERFLTECARVLRPGGRVLLTTPNRLTFSPGRDTPLNPFHTRELAPSELDGLLRDAGFTVERLQGLHHGRRLQELDAAHGGSLIAAQVALAVDDGTWPRQLLADVASVTTTDFMICSDNLENCLDLVAVAVTPGSPAP